MARSSSQWLCREATRRRALLPEKLVRAPVATVAAGAFLRRGDAGGTGRRLWLLPLTLLLVCLCLPVRAQGVRAWAGSDPSAAEAQVQSEAQAERPLRLAAASPVAAVPPEADSAAMSTARVGGSGSLVELLAGGGVLMVPLLLCSFAVVVFGIERAVSLRSSQVVPTVFVERFIERLQGGQLDRAAAAAACAEHPSPSARAFAAAVRRWGRPAVEVEQAVIDACEREINHLRKYRRVFNGVATVSPLFGLLGTVLGLIRSFNDVAAAGAIGRPDLLARGFGEALITTALGLMVAIPAMVLHSYFTSRVDRLAMQLDEACQPVIEAVAFTTGESSERRKVA